jgi:hypothetical protein
VSKDVSSRQDKQPMSFTHAVAMTAVGVVGVIVAFWIIGGVFSIIWFFVKIAVIIALIAGVFWLISRLRN